MSKVDSREPKEITIPLRRAGWELTALPYGDMEFKDAIGQTILWERKAVSQLIPDIRSGTLQRQCRGMKENSDIAVLLIEGRLQFNRETGDMIEHRQVKRPMKWHNLWKLLTSIQTDLGIKLQFTTSIDDTVERLFQFEDYYRQEVHFSTLGAMGSDPYVANLSLVYGISIAKAKEIKAKFPHLVEVMMATEEELAEVPGVGSKLARRLYEFWRK